MERLRQHQKSSYGMDAYSVDGAEAYSAEGDGKEAAPADYNGMNYAAAAAGTGADADSSGGAVVLSENEASAAVGTEVAEASADEAGTAENAKKRQTVQIQKMVKAAGS